jgi:hypothetical protein
MIGRILIFSVGGRPLFISGSRFLPATPPTPAVFDILNTTLAGILRLIYRMIPLYFKPLYPGALKRRLELGTFPVDGLVLSHLVDLSKQGLQINWLNCHRISPILLYRALHI